MSENDDFIETTVRSLLNGELDELALKIVTGDDGLDRTILRPRVQKPGLAFAGYYEYIKPGRGQIIGESEAEDLKTLGEEERFERLDQNTPPPIPVVVVTKGPPPPPRFLTLCQNPQGPGPSSP